MCATKRFNTRLCTNVLVMFVEFVNFRADEKLKRDAEKLAELEEREKADEYREIFRLGVAEKKKKLALARYASGEVSFGKAAEMAGLSAWEFLEEMKKAGVHLNLTAEDVLEAAGEIE